MAVDTDDEWSRISPEWIPLADIHRWVRARFSLVDNNLLVDLVTTLRKRNLRHRIRGVDRQGSGRYPPGLDSGPTYYVGSHHVVTDWEAAEVDWTRGTVAGSPRGYGDVIRCPIELECVELEDWVKGRIERSRNSERRARQLAQIAPPLKGGRKPSHDWDRFWIEVSLWTAANDVAEESSRRRLQKYMSDATATWEPPMDEATVRGRIKLLFDEWQKRARST